MHDHQPPSVPGALPRRFDTFLGATAALSTVLIAVFLGTQCVSGLRVNGDVRFEIVLWLVEIGGVSGICFGVRPHIAHVHYAMQIGLHRGAPFHTLLEDYPRQLAARRILWRRATALAVLSWLATAIVEVAANNGLVSLHGSNLHTTAELLSSPGCVGVLVRVLGPDLAELDRVFRAACDYAARTTPALPGQRQDEPRLHSTTEL